MDEIKNITTRCVYPLNQHETRYGCRGCLYVPVNGGLHKCDGVASFWLLAALVFVATFAGVISLQYQATQTTDLAAVPADMETPAQAPDTPQSDLAEKQPIGQEGKPEGGTGTNTLLAGLLDETDEPVEVATHPAASETDEQHAEWVDQLYVQLNSLEPPAAGIEIKRLETSGRVLDQAGLPVQGLEVIARPQRIFGSDDHPDADLQASAQKTRSGGNGTFSFRGIPDGEYEIMATSNRHLAARAVVRAGVTDTVLLMQERGRILEITGAVISTVGEPLSRVRVMPVSQEASFVFSDVGGEYALQLPLIANWRTQKLRFQREGFKDKVVPVSLGADESQSSASIDVVMEPVEAYAVVSGTLRDHAGQPVPGETVQIFSPRLNRHYRTRSDDQGLFSLAKVEPSSDYKVTVHPSAGYKDYIKSNLHVGAEGRQLNIELKQLLKGNRLAGQLVDNNANPVPHFQLNLRSRKSAGYSVPLVTDGNGYFSVTDAPDGPLVLETRSMPRLTVNIDRRAIGNPSNLPLVVDLGPNQLSGQVLDRQGEAVAASNVHLTWSYSRDGISSLSNRRVMTDAKGNFVFRGLGTGRYLLQVAAQGYQGSQIEHHVGTGASEVEVHLDQVYDQI